MNFNNFSMSVVTDEVDKYFLVNFAIIVIKMLNHDFL